MKDEQGKVRMVGYVRPVEGDTLPIESADPAVWMINRLRTDEDGAPLMEGIFANYNDDILLEADEMTLIGRYDPARGPAQRIGIGDGLSIENGELTASGVPGPVGPQGPVGPEGPAGASSSMFLYRFDSNTSPNDPGAGRCKMNNTNPQLCTKWYIDRLTQDGLDPTIMFTIAQFDDQFIVQERGMSLHYQQWKLLGPAYNYGDWFEIPVQWVGQSGANFNNNQELTFLMRTTGKQGPPGQWTQITQAAYNALNPPDPAVLYVIIG